MKWSDVNTPDVDDSHMKKSLEELASSALAVKISIERDSSLEGILSEISRMNDLLGFVKSGCSVKVLSKMAGKK